MEVAVIGAGYVGLVTGAGLASLGHRVRLGETSAERVASLKAGEVPIFEEGLGELIAEGRESGRLSFHTDNLEAAAEAEFVFLCLPTPPGLDGRADLSFVEGVLEQLALAVSEDAIFVVKSTVPPAPGGAG